MFFTSFGLAYVGLVFLSMSLKRHYAQALPENTNYVRYCLLNRILGYCLLALSLYPCMNVHGFGVAIVVWVSILAAASFLQAMLLCYWPTRNLLFSGAGLALIVMGLVL